MSDQNVQATSAFVYTKPKKKRQPKVIVEDTTPTPVHSPQALIDMDVAMIKHQLAMLESRHHEIVSREEFEPIRKVVYGLISMILLSVVGAIVSLVMV